MLTSNDIATIYDNYFEKIYRFFYYKFLSKDIAEDLTSETFMEFIAQLKKTTNASIKEPEKYLFGVAKNMYLAHLRQKYHQIPTYDVEQEQDFGSVIDDCLEEVDETPTIEEYALKFIAKLPDKQREVARLRFIDKLSLSDIATKLHKNMNYVKTTQKRAIKSLKEIVALAKSTNKSI
jgi:RNA polymerase sigma-70 factor (ECF subfamily)